MENNISALAAAREEINNTDREMARLFEKRMAAAEKIAAYKKQNGLPIEDKTREALLIEKNEKYIERLEKYRRKLKKAKENKTEE